jgi:hypothetical protein
VLCSANAGPCSLCINELKIENSSKVKVRKIYLPKREGKKATLKLRTVLTSGVQKPGPLRGHLENTNIFNMYIGASNSITAV